MTRLIAWLLIATVAAGCATAKPAPAQVELQEKKDRQECAEAAAKSVEPKALVEGASTGVLVGAILILEGASQGAFWGFVTGGSAADGAWIGAAVGAGIGTIVGLVVGIKKGVEQHRKYRDAYDRCLSERGQRASAA